MSSSTGISPSWSSSRISNVLRSSCSYTLEYLSRMCVVICFIADWYCLKIIKFVIRSDGFVMVDLFFIFFQLFHEACVGSADWSGFLYDLQTLWKAFSIHLHNVGCEESRWSWYPSSAVDQYICPFSLALDEFAGWFEVLFDLLCLVVHQIEYLVFDFGWVHETCPNGWADCWDVMLF